MSSPPRVFAIVPAAGRSRRMGIAKQLLPVGGQTMLEAVLAPLAAAPIAGIVIVTHSELAKRITAFTTRAGRSTTPLALREGPGEGTAQEDAAPPIFLAINDDETSEMIDSVRIGLRAWSQRTSPADHDGFLVCPADQPGITTADFATCIAAFRQSPDKVIVATRADRRGHPLIFPAPLAAFAHSPACDNGLNALPRQHADRVCHVPCHSPAVTRDVDTPQDYDGLR